MAKRKVKKKRRKTPDRYKPLVSKLQSKGLLDKYNVEVRYEPSGVAKMSQVVIDFIEPYAEYAETYEAYQKLVMVAIVAWNTTLLPEKKQKAMVKIKPTTQYPHYQINTTTPLSYLCSYPQRGKEIQLGRLLLTLFLLPLHHFTVD